MCVEGALPQVPVEAGSQLVAHFADDLDPAALREKVEGLVTGTLGSAPGVCTNVTVAKGASTVVYITSYREVNQAKVGQMVGKLTRMGASVKYLSGNKDKSGVLRFQAEGMPCFPMPVSCRATL